MAHDPRVVTALQEVVDEVDTRLARIEQIKRFTVLEHDLSQAAGELTPTLKIKRSVVHREFADDLSALYEETRT